MTKRSDITRRDFLNGAALSLAAGSTLTPIEILAAVRGEDYYPPSLAGMRGSHPGSYEVTHAVSLRASRYARPRQQTDKTYDLVVVGGGISGLSTAYLAQQRADRLLNILVLDNHDDFGGHAKRNEFTVDGKQLIGYGGSQTIQEPAKYSKVAGQLLKDVAIQPERFYEYYDQQYFSKRKLGSGLYFPSKHYGRDVLAPNIFESLIGSSTTLDIPSVLQQYPISSDARAALLRLLMDEKDYLAGRSQEQKRKLMLETSYNAFLQQYAGVPEEVTRIFRDMPRGIWGVGWEACSALEGFRWGLPGTQHLGLGKLEKSWTDFEEPYIFHFPDGNAGVARSLVRQLIPAAVPGSTMEDLVQARVDYSQLDSASSPVRIRLNSSAVNIEHTADQKAVDVTYVNGGEAYRVRGEHVVYAGYHNMLPHICPELPEDQAAAINSVTKVPLVYINVALRNWRAFSELGIHHVSCAQPELMHTFGMDFPVSMGGYQYTQTPDQPTVVHGTYVPALPDSGLSNKRQHIGGRGMLYQLSFADFEEKIVSQMNGALGGGGFDAERDIAAITVNRWPHGYAYEYNELFDDPSFGPEKGPHITARKQIGRISIGNSDSSAYAYVDGAIDAADRAVNEQF